MSQPSGPQEGSSTYIEPIPAREGEPPIVEKAPGLSFAARISLYYTTLGIDVDVVQKLVLLKTTRLNAKDAKEGYNLKQQTQAFNAARSHSKEHKWIVTDYNMGCCLASGLTQSEELCSILELWPEEIKEIENGEKIFHDKHPAITHDNDACRDANRRMLVNRTHFPERVKQKDSKRLAEQDKQGYGASAPQPTPEYVAFHTTMIGLAAVEIQRKREQERREEGN